MIKKKQTFKIGTAEFDFDPKKRYVVMRFAGKKVALDKKELWMMVFAISKEKDQDDLIPVVKKEMMSFERIFQIKATKDVKEGEVMKFHTRIDVPATVLAALIDKPTWEECVKSLNAAQALIPSPFAKVEGKGV